MNSHLQRAQLLMEQDRHEQAVGELQRHLAEDPNNPSVHALMALCLSEQERFPDATRAAQTAVHLGPDMALTHYALACVMCDRNRFREARQAIDEAIRLDPEHAGYFARLAQIHFAESHWSEALDAADQGLACDAEDIGCANLRAMSLVKLGRKAQAGVAIDAALARNPENALTHANQGWTLLEQHQPLKAMEHFREALRLDPELDWARSGIVEAMKARNVIYRYVLSFFLWMAKLTPRARWGLIIGGLVGQRVLGGIADANPVIAPWIQPLLVAYIAFVVTTWIADPLFNLLLRLNRFGRLVLSRDQVAASNWLGLCLLATVAALVWWACGGGDLSWIAIVIFGLLTIPVSAVYHCRAGGPRTIMAVYTTALAVVGLTVVVLLVIQPNDAVFGSMALVCAKTFFWGVLGSQFLANVLMSMRHRR